MACFLWLTSPCSPPWSSVRRAQFRRNRSQTSQKRKKNQQEDHTKGREWLFGPHMSDLDILPEVNQGRHEKCLFIYSAFLFEWVLPLSKAPWDTMQGQHRETEPDSEHVELKRTWMFLSCSTESCVSTDSEASSGVKAWGKVNGGAGARWHIDTYIKHTSCLLSVLSPTEIRFNLMS